MVYSCFFGLRGNLDFPDFLQKSFITSTPVVDFESVKLMGDEGSYLPNCQTNLVIALHALSLLLCNFIYTTGYHLGKYKLSSPSTKELHGKGKDHCTAHFQFDLFGFNRTNKSVVI